MILRRVASDAGLAERHGRPADEVAGLLERARVALLGCPRPAAPAGPRRQGAGRLERPDAGAPSRTPRRCWRATATPALGAAAARYLALAERAAERLLDVLRAPDGRFLRSWKDGRARHAGTLEDQACMADGPPRALRGDRRRALVRRRARDRRRDPRPLRRPGRRLPRHGRRRGDARRAAAVARGQRRPVGRRDGGDGAPAAGRPHRRGPLRRRGRGGARRRRAPRPAPTRRRSPSGSWRSTGSSGPVDEIAIVGDPADPRTARLAAVGARRPAATSAGGRARSSRSARTRRPSSVPLLQGRFALRGPPTAFVCRSFACRQPVTEPEALAAILAGG